MVRQVEDLAGGGPLEDESVKLMLQAVGITVVGQLVSRLCKDAGESALSYTVELAARAAVDVYKRQVQQRGQRGGRDAVADGVASYVGTQSLEPLGVQVAQGSQVQLHGEAPGSVLPAQEIHEQGLVGGHLVDVYKRQSLCGTCSRCSRPNCGPRPST